MDEAIAAVAKTGTGVVAMKVMAGGFRTASRPGAPVNSRCKREGAMLAALKWVLQATQYRTPPSPA